MTGKQVFLLDMIAKNPEIILKTGMDFVIPGATAIVDLAGVAYYCYHGNSRGALISLGSCAYTLASCGVGKIILRGALSSSTFSRILQQLAKNWKHETWKPVINAIKSGSIESIFRKLFETAWDTATVHVICNELQKPTSKKDS